MLFTPEEQAYNDSTGTPEDRIALWPGSMIADGQGNGIVFYLKLRVKNGFEFHGIGLARVQSGSLVAVREPGLLFTFPEPNFDNATIVAFFRCTITFKEACV